MIGLESYSNKLEFEANDKMISVNDGHQFVKNLKKEARRQRDIKQAKNLMSQGLPVEFLPAVESRHEEIELSETFEIIEE